LGRVLVDVGIDVLMERERNGRILERLSCPTSE